MNSEFFCISLLFNWCLVRLLLILLVGCLYQVVSANYYSFAADSISFMFHLLAPTTRNAHARAFSRNTTHVQHIFLNLSTPHNHLRSSSYYCWSDIFVPCENNQCHARAANYRATPRMCAHLSIKPHTRVYLCQLAAQFAVRTRNAGFCAYYTRLMRAPPPTPMLIMVIIIIINSPPHIQSLTQHTSTPCACTHPQRTHAF